jgi:hypothetical protein
MTVKLNRKGYEHARKLIRDGDVVRDERDDWSEHAPDADQENRFVDKNGWGEFSEWHLGVDDDASEETKGRFSFPYGDFKKIHRCAVISAESRASQHDHADIRKALGELMELIDSEEKK